MEEKAKILCSNSLIGGFYCLLDDVKENSQDMFCENIIVVPDRFTLNAERLVFEYLKLESSFNIQVMSLTRLVNKILAKKLDKYEILSQNMGLMLITKIMLDNKEKFAVYKSLSPAVCSEFYNTIIQLKSSGITPQELLTKKQDLVLNSKLEDIKFVYEQYLSLCENTKLDSADLLKLFSQEVLNSEYIKKSKIYVGMFDCFSFRQMQSITALAKASQNFSIYLSANTVQENKRIYINETLQQVIESFRLNKISYKIENKIKNISKISNFIAKNLFSTPKSKLSCSNVLMVEAEDVNEEIDFVARKIKQLVLQEKYKFSNINIACCNFQDYKLEIEKIFEQYTLPVYFDYQSSLSEHFFPKFVFNLLDMFRLNFPQDLVMNYLKSAFVNASDEEFNSFNNYVVKYGIDHNVFLTKFFDEEIEIIRSKYLSFLESVYKKFKKCSKVNDYLLLLNEIIAHFECEKVLNDISTNENNNIEFARATSQVYNKFTETMQLVSLTLGETVCDENYFYSLLENAVSSVKLSNVPLGVNKIFVGDANSSSFMPNKCLFVVGACDGSFPSYKNDCGMITDREIELLDSTNLLSPSIQFVNKCTKYGTLELLLCATENLYVSYPSLMFNVESAPSEVFDALKNIFNTSSGNELNFYKVASELDYLKLNNSKNNLNFVFGNNFHKNKLLSKQNGNDNVTTNNYDNCDKNESLISFKDLFFPNKTVSVSEIERYFACPYIHFVEYGLRLKEKEVFGLKSVDFGNFLHKIAENFVKMLIKNNFEFKESEVLALINKIAESDFYSKSYCVEKSKITSLTKEAFVMCQKIYSQICLSDFKPTHVEQKFVSPFEIEGLKIKGKIDRLDAYQNYFVVYDYKTGKNDFNYKDVFYGNKIQSLVYLSIIENLENKMGVGAFYIPIKSKFIDDDMEDKFNGVFVNQKDILEQLDKTLLQDSSSKIFKIKFKNDGSLYSTSEKYALSPLEIKKLKDYVLKIFSNAVKQICDGNISPCPSKDGCKYCKYASLCGYDIENFGYRKKELEISKQNFTEILKEAENGKQN